MSFRPQGVPLQSGWGRAERPHPTPIKSGLVPPLLGLTVIEAGQFITIHLAQYWLAILGTPSEMARGLVKQANFVHVWVQEKRAGTIRDGQWNPIT